MTKWWIVSLALFTSACEGGLAPDDDTDLTDPETDAPVGDTDVDTPGEPEGVFSVDATSHDDWTHINLATGRPTSGDDWDVAFRRADVMLAEGAEAIPVAEELSEDMVVPASGWLTDQLGDEPTYALGTWYDYDPVNHTLWPADGAFLVRNPAGTVFGLQFHGYYDAAGTSAHYTMASVVVEEGGEGPGEEVP